MATTRLTKCTHCTPAADKGTLFRTLLRIADDPNQPCECGGTRSVHLGFDFGLGATDKESEIEAAFRPQPLESWTDRDGSTVTFYPFLVVLKRSNRKRAVWMPYWHVVESSSGKRKEKYGQWAPVMDESLFESLLAQAQKAGILTPPTTV